MITRRRRQGSSESEHFENVIIIQDPNSQHWLPNQGGESEPPSYNYSQIADANLARKPDNMAMASSVSAPNLTMLSSSSNSSRDRTAEFFTAVRSLQSRPSNGSIPQQAVRAVDPHRQQYSEFMRIAKLISKDLSSTYSKLEKLTILAKKRSLFDDRPQEIQELTYIVREDITNLNKQIGQLQGFMKKQQSQQQQNSKAHSANVVVALQSKLATMSSEFKQVLEVRTENLKAQKSRREQFSGSGPVLNDLPAGALTGGPFGSSQKGSVLLRDAYKQDEAVSIDMGGVGDQQLTHRNQQLQQRVFADETESYLQSRSDAVQSIESTIVELGGIFQQLALMVREQEEMVQRIDSNVEDAQMNVEAAHDELLRYFRSISSNRWLMVKVFGIVIVFVLIFAIFFA